jgi:hypothetical protein
MIAMFRPDFALERHRREGGPIGFAAVAQPLIVGTAYSCRSRGTISFFNFSDLELRRVDLLQKLMNQATSPW